MAPSKKGGTTTANPVQPAKIQRLDSAPEAHSTSPGSVVLTPRGYILTIPDDDTIYGVKDDQLDLLAAGGRSTALDTGLLALGVGLGFVPQAFWSAKAIYEGQQSTLWDTVGLCLFVALLVLAAVKLLQHRNQKKSIDNLVTKIKAGQQIKIG